MRKKQSIDTDAIGINPFKINLKIPVAKFVDVGKFNRDEDGILHPDRYMIDKREHVKIFRFPGLRKVIVKMIPSAHLLLWYICMKIEKDCEYLAIDRLNFMNEAEIKSVNTYKAGVKELIKYCFIAEVIDHTDVYWINPAYFYNGNAITKYPDNINVEYEVLKRTKKATV